jgi:hypothetical protein
MVLPGIKRVLATVLMLLIVTTASAQLCNAQINFTLFYLGEKVELVLPSEYSMENKVYKFESKGFDISIHGDKQIHLVQYAGTPYQTINLRCAQKIELVIRKKGSFKKMKIRFENIADAHFGIEIPFQRGSQTITINTSGSLSEVYKTQVNQGYDITPDSWKKLISR